MLLLCATLAGADDFVETHLWGQREPWVSATVPGLRARRAVARHAWRGDPRHRPGLVQGVLHVVGRGAARGRARHRGDRRQDVAAQPRAAPRARAAAPGVGLGEPPAPGVGSAGGGGQVERDHRHPAAARAPGLDRRPGDHRRHRHAEQDRRGHPRARRRLPAGAEGQSAGPAHAMSGTSSPIQSCEVGDRHDTTDADHGRIEVRRHAVCHDVGLAVLRSTLCRRAHFPGAHRHRHGRGRDRARRQDPL